MRRMTIRANGVDLDVHSMGDANTPLLLFLHGFPEHADSWAEVIPEFADRYHAVAPNQRGYAGSSKPEGVAAYAIKHLVRDMLALAEQLSPDRPFTVVGHDWGGAVAYALAIAAPRRVAKLAVINGVHPGPFQKALIEDAAQQAASSYMHELRAGDAERQLSADAHAGLMRKMARFGDLAWMTGEKRSAYLQAWSDVGALTGMLNWYRASPLAVPKAGETVDMAKVPRLDPGQLRVRMPHLLIWGMQDKALLPVSRTTLQDYCDHPVVVREIEGADHWIVHQRRDEVVALLKDFLKAVQLR
jgi:pimeloyl-ACP methyl ester carboxylesterase